MHVPSKISNSLAKSYIALFQRYNSYNTIPFSSLSSPCLVQELFHGLERRDRYALSKTITLIESHRSDHRKQAQELLSLVLKSDKEKEKNLISSPRAFRIGLSGSPGVGKSTFIEAFGMHLIKQGHRVAVLAVDPSSSKTGGSILGDKTRMTYLSREDNAFVRPSPSRGTLGGVARNTDEAIILCEKAGFDITLVETVGVGQSETMVAEMVDIFVLLVPPAGGDELQGLKKGIVELADLVIVNKSDGNFESAAKTAQMEYLSALKYIKKDGGSWSAKVMRISAQTGFGINEVWETISDFFNIAKSTGELSLKRATQRQRWMWRQISNELLDRLNSNTQVKAMVREMEISVQNGELTSGQAADKVVDSFLNRLRQDNI